MRQPPRDRRRRRAGVRRTVVASAAVALALATGLPAAAVDGHADLVLAQATDDDSPSDEASAAADALTGELADNAEEAERAQAELELTEADIRAAAEQLALIERRLADAERSLAVAEGQLALGHAAADDAETARQLAEKNLSASNALLETAQSALEAEEALLADQVASTYKYGTAQQGTVALRMLGQLDEPDQIAHNLYQLRAVLDWQQAAVERVETLRQERSDLSVEAAEAHDLAVSSRRDAAAALELVQNLTDQARDLEAQVRSDRNRQQLVLDQLERNADAKRAVLANLASRRTQLQRELAQQRAQAEARDGVICPSPIGAVSFINDWGFPRSGGRTHKGTDVFAATGTPVYAMADATVRRVDRTDTYVVGSGRGDLGGRSVSLWVSGDEYWYFAHLDTVVDGLNTGDRVTQGQLIGTVGNSGNAATTPPHTHVGRYVDGTAINPFPTLDAVCR